MPTSFFVLSRENLELAKDEIISIAKSYDRFAKAETFSNVVIIESKTNWTKIASRATFVKFAGQLLKKMSSLFLDEESFTLLQNAKSFACKVIDYSTHEIDVPEIEKTFGNMVSKFSNTKVSLDNPDVIVYLIFTDEQSFFGFANKKLEIIRPKKPKNHPHELDWRLCRAMINLAGLKEGETVCDPFCGTGTTLLEAESMGIHSIGIDFDEKMYEISKENIKANGFNSKIFKADFSQINKFSDIIDGIVTDLPYGRASKSSDIPEKVLQKFLSIMPRKKKFAIMCKKGLEPNLNFEATKRYDIYRHKSLTRTILVK